MTDKPEMSSSEGLAAPRIVVIGVGGAGGNAVNNMIEAQLAGVEFLVANTDAQALAQSRCDRLVQLGRGVTRGLGAGSQPDVGRAAAEEALDEVLGHIEGANMVFITAGMGGGTGTGGAPVIARAARECGILTVGVVTKPFQFEGVRRMRMADAGISELTQYVDTLIVIPNQNLFRVVNEKTTFADAFKMADDVLHSGVRGVTDLMVMPGLINLDFADIRSVMTEMGKAIMGTGEAEGEGRALAAAEAAISNPLLDEMSMKGARGVLINITGGLDLTLFEVDQAANRIREEVDQDANIIFGSTFQEDLDGRMRVSIVATGIDVDQAERPKPVPLSLVVSRAGSRQKAAPQRPAEEEAPPPTPARPEPAPAETAGGPIADEPAAPEPAPPAAEEASATVSGAGAEGAGTVRPWPSLHPAPGGFAQTAPNARSAGAASEAKAEPSPMGEPLGAASSTAARSDEPELALKHETELRTAPAAEPAEEASDTATAETEEGELSPERTVGAEGAPRTQRRRSNGLFSWMTGSGAASAEELFEKGDRYYYGQGVRKNYALALRAYEKAAELGHAAAQNRLGWMYEKGEGVDADYATAVQWYRRAADQGHVNAMNDLGYMYRQGWGVEQSYSEALSWFGKAAEKYDSYAEYNMGQMYENGWGVEKDLNEAIRWFRRSAARGHEWAAKRLEELGVRT